MSWGELANALARSEVVITFSGGEFLKKFAADAGKKIEFTYPKEGTFAWLDSYCIAKGAPNREAAHKCANQALEVDGQVAFGEKTFQAIVMPEAIDKLQPATKALYPYDNLGGVPEEGEVLPDAAARARWHACQLCRLAGGVPEVQGGVECDDRGGPRSPAPASSDGRSRRQGRHHHRRRLRHRPRRRAWRLPRPAPRSSSPISIEEGGEPSSQEIGAGTAVFQPVDVRDTLQVQRLVADTVARFGRIDALFHNAMNVPLVNRGDGRATELPKRTWHEIIDLVLNGTFYCCKYVGQQMLKQSSGSLILTATTDALIGQAGIDAYTAAKGGVVAMTRSLAAGLSPEGVRVNAICPGFVETPHQAPFMGNPAERRKIEDLHLMGILQPEEIADFAVYLASDKAKRMTGGIHVVDSGYTAFKGRMALKETIAR